jgi:hypothetical protein
MNARDDPQQFPLKCKELKGRMIKISRNRFLIKKPILMGDRKGEESGSDLPLHSGVLAMPEFRIRTRKQFTRSGNCWMIPCF